MAGPTMFGYDRVHCNWYLLYYMGLVVLCCLTHSEVVLLKLFDVRMYFLF